MHLQSCRFPEARKVRESRRLGTLVRDGKLDKELNNELVDELVAWSERNGQQPQWIGQEVLSV